MEPSLSDITVNKLLIGEIRERYYRYLSEQASSFQPGVRVKVSREKLVEIVEQSFDEINCDQKFDRSITRSFQICGLDPWTSILEKVSDHLDSLTTNRVYEKLVRVKHQEAVIFK